MVRFVEHQPAVGWQHRCFLPIVGRNAHREVGGEQVVIDDDDIGLGGAASRREDKALIEVGALESRAQVRLGRHRVPDFARRLFYQIGEAAVGSSGGPACDRLELGGARVVEQPFLARARLLEP